MGIILVRRKLISYVLLGVFLVVACTELVNIFAVATGYLFDYGFFWFGRLGLKLYQWRDIWLLVIFVVWLVTVWLNGISG